MMIRWLKPLFLLLGLVAISTVSAHENTPPEIPPITQRCVTIVENPPDDWTFEGTIVMYREGIQGFRADMSTGYYIAFDGYNQFPASGTFSPDGQWFVSFWGKTNYATMLDNEYEVTHLVITSTHPRRETYLIPFQDYDDLSSFPSFWQPVWIDNTQFVIRSGEYAGDKWFLVEPFEGRIQNISEEEAKALIETVNPPESAIDLFGDDRYKSVPENPPRAFLFHDLPNTRLYITDSVTNQIYDTCLTVYWGYTVSPTGDQVAAPVGGLEGFVYVIDLNDWTAYRLDLPASPVIAWAVDP